MSVHEPAISDATRSAPPRRLDHDSQIALEEERDHLAGSLRDLDVEHAAGDLTPEDYAALRDDYVVRMAAVLRALDAQQRPVDSTTTTVGGGPPRWLVALGVAVFAIGAGLLVARVAGTRTSGDGLTGEVRASTRQELSRCLELANVALRGAAADAGGTGAASATGAADANVPAAPPLLDAVKCYSEVLRRSPGSAEALTYRGWLLVRIGDPAVQQQALRDLDAAVAADPAYPDARAFRAIVHYRAGELDEARSDLDVLDTLDTPPIIDQLLTQFGVRQAVAAGTTPGGPATTAG